METTYILIADAHRNLNGVAHGGDLPGAADKGHPFFTGPELAARVRQALALPN
jgi:hypothetical protein